MGLLCNLYPPTLNSSSPAFIRTTDCKIHFSLSFRNNEEEIKSVQITANSQKTNVTGFSTSLYPNGIKLVNWEDVGYDEEWDGDDKYYVTISPSDMNGGSFPLNEFFKVQMRLTHTDAASGGADSSVWLINNAPYFSEWSRVCLIKGIDEPTISLTGLQKDVEGEIAYLSSPTLELYGEFSYGSDDTSNIEAEYLTQYRVKIYEMDDLDTVICDSDLQYMESYNSRNQINYTARYLFETGVKYRIALWFCTNNQFEDTYYYNFLVADEANAKLNENDSIIAVENEKLGCIEVTYSLTAFVGNLIIRRSGSDSNFQIWDDVYTRAYTPAQTVQDQVWRDLTVESGVFYIYGIQKRTSNGSRGPMIIADSVSMVELDSAYLAAEELSLKLAYDFKISNFSYKVVESSTETLGSKYPFVRRNGDVKYRTFTMTGLISSLMDDQEAFATREELQQDSKKYYDKYNTAKLIDSDYDYIYERAFREKVMDFLYKDNVKLFRSGTEGNILIKLMNISFTPNEVLGRMLYSFSATAYEVDEATPSNYQIYNIQPMSEFVKYVSSCDTEVSYNNLFIAANKNVISVLAQNYDIGTTGSSILETDKFYMNNIKISIESDPYVITDSNGTLLVASKGNTASYYGYIANINGEAIFISSDGTCTLNDVCIKTLTFPVDTILSVEGTSVVTLAENTSNNISSSSYSKLAGQLCGFYQYSSDKNIIEDIINKHGESTSTYTIKVQDIDSIIIETEPNIVFKVGTLDEEGELITNSDGMLILNNDMYTKLYLIKDNSNTYKDGVDVLITYTTETVKEVY